MITEEGDREGQGAAGHTKENPDLDRRIRSSQNSGSFQRVLHNRLFHRSKHKPDICGISCLCETAKR